VVEERRCGIEIEDEIRWLARDQLSEGV